MKIKAIVEKINIGEHILAIATNPYLRFEIAFVKTDQNQIFEYYRKDDNFPSGPAGHSFCNYEIEYQIIEHATLDMINNTYKFVRKPFNIKDKCKCKLLDKIKHGCCCK